LTIALLAERRGVTRDTMRDHVNALEDEGAIDRERIKQLHFVVRIEA
jgi:DNA-binding MarR family transcriptional regulator